MAKGWVGLAPDVLVLPVVLRIEAEYPCRYFVVCGVVLKNLLTVFVLLPAQRSSAATTTRRRDFKQHGLRTGAPAVTKDAVESAVRGPTVQFIQYGK